MASIGHVAVGMAAARRYGWGTRGESGLGALIGSMVWWSELALLPDADVIGLHWGVRYGSQWGHRGASHSLVFAFAIGTLIGMMAPLFGRRRLQTTVFAVTTLASHGLLDALTNGGRGCALFWPFSLQRFFAPFRPIPVAPIGTAFLSERGLHVALVELGLFLPVFLYALWPRAARPPRR